MHITADGKAETLTLKRRQINPPSKSRNKVRKDLSKAEKSYSMNHYYRELQKEDPPEWKSNGSNKSRSNRFAANRNLRERPKGGVVGFISKEKHGATC